MQFPFTYDITIAGRICAQIEGAATVEPCDYDDWIITHLTVWAGEDIDVPKHDPMHKTIMDHLLREEDAISIAWAEHVFECRAERMELA